MIFIIDDDKSVLRALSLLLRVAGFQTEVYSSVTKFLEQARISNSDCIILDLNMPTISGFDLMKSLISKGINAKIIIITAYDNEKNRERARELNAAAFLTKPVDDQALIDTINWVFQPVEKNNR